MEKNIGSFYRIAFTLCPILALAFSILVTITTLYLNESFSIPFIFISIQVYLNWYSIYTISRNATTMRDNSSDNARINSVAIRMSAEDDSGPRLRYWYCNKCCCYTYKPTQHCSACKKCFHFRDHHCFFIGGCIIRQNMGNFILICFHTSLACFYSSTVVGSYLYESLSDSIGHNSSVLNIILNFCFPIALAKLIIIGQNNSLLLVILFDTLFSVFIVCLVYGGWKFYCCLMGKQRYYPHVARKQDLREIFGSYGLSNIIFPYNGLLGSRDIDGRYQLKEI